MAVLAEKGSLVMEELVKVSFMSAKASRNMF